MRKKLRVYLDTSVINFIFADDAPEKKEITIDFFDNFIAKLRYQTFISDFVLAEIDATTNFAKKEQLMGVLRKYPIEILEISNITEIQELANQYIISGIIPQKKSMDAYHISVSVVCDINYLVSWNYKHLANINKEQKVRSLNIANGYINELRIITPLELIDYGDNNI